MNSNVVSDRRQKRSAIMRAVKGRDTKPELAVRKLLRPIASGYRLHRKDIPGCPDIVFVGRKLAVFVHGCFWHGHRCRRGARIPKSNKRYWVQKISRNQTRDRKIRNALRKSGWRVLVIWECQLKEPQALSASLRAFVKTA
jgi:DNA mismatch endonuclease, patch repair protein